MAARFIVTNGLSLEEYVRMWEEEETELRSGRYSLQYYDKGLDTVWSSALSQLSRSSREILQVISFLDPDYIQDEILIQSPTIALDEFPRNNSDLFRSRSELLRVSLIGRSSKGNGLHVHRLVQSAVRERMDPNEYRNSWSTAVALVSSAWIHANSSEQGRPPNLKIRDDLLPHVVQLKDFATEMTDSEEDFCTNTDFVKLLGYVKE